MRKHCLKLIAALAILPTTALPAQSELDAFIGTWVMRLGARNLFVLKIKRAHGAVTGSFDRPSKLQETNGAFANMAATVRHNRVSLAEFKDGALHLKVLDSADRKDTDTYVMTVARGVASLGYDNLPPGLTLAPMRFQRAQKGAKVATDWQPNRLYRTTDSDAPSAEMSAIFTEDQRVRTGTPNNIPELVRTDAERRERTRALLTSGSLHTGKDFEQASFVFQHGNTAEDYLLAHTLAMIAVSKGDATAIWIASATLDRYLEKIGQKQIYGTQFSHHAPEAWTQEPYDRLLISDALREQLAVPSQAEQIRQLEVYKRQ